MYLISYVDEILFLLNWYLKIIKKILFQLYLDILTGWMAKNIDINFNHYWLIIYFSHIFLPYYIHCKIISKWPMLLTSFSEILFIIFLFVILKQIPFKHDDRKKR